ncbi:MAG TPA: hypothetical protein VK716_13380 [Terracidiphilus sp.]|nr:hypothetical protein [Terracidiphilus sp.]
MQRSRFFAILYLVTLACAASLPAQDAPKDKDKPQNSAGQAGGSVAKRQDAALHVKPAQTLVGNTKLGPPQKQMVRTPQQELDQQAAQREAWQQRRANHWDYEHQNWQQRGGYPGAKIPDDFLQSHYGPNHPFKMFDLPFSYQDGNPRFQYEGYWFTMVDPYPESWAGYWYQDDDLYVDYRGDGYYLFNRGYPKLPGIAIQASI